MKRQLKKSDRGFTLLYTLLVVSLVLVVSSSILGIIQKEVALSGFSRDSQIAYYAAESAAECLLFAALNGNPLDGSTALECNGEPVLPIPIMTVPPEAAVPLTVTFDSSPVCAVVTITNVSGSRIIESRGRNTCANTIRRVERGIKVVF